MTRSRSEELFAQAQALLPGGVSSPVRAFRAVGGTPVFVERGSGAFIRDVDGRSYIDYVLSWGPLALGHAHPRVVAAVCEAAERGLSFGAPTELENRLAERIRAAMPSIELVRFVTSGTEACMSALRLARAATGRTKVVKFAGGYHGHADAMLAQAGSGVATFGLPDSPGVTPGATADTIVVEYNDLPALKALFAERGDEIACVIVEPCAGNMGLVLPEDGFLHGIQSLCRAHGALFVLDEVMTGFRVAPGGAQGLWGLDPDITCLGKVIGGGLPVGAYGGKRRFLELVAPAGPVYQAGTLAGNPLAMAAGLATIEGLLAPGVFPAMVETAQAIVAALEAAADEAGVPLQAAACGTMFGFFFLSPEALARAGWDEAGRGPDGRGRPPGRRPVRDFATARRLVDTARYARFFHAMLEEGVYLPPSAFESCFVSAAHGPREVEATRRAARRAMARVAG
ncbi:MAG: glutamate-1-semialdehyde 2,1-aminomutase [Clostridia bacterium]|nr:glutamate-1-semialdehyde 2,1-aminomutase [Clostridia bacterium]